MSEKYTEQVNAIVNFGGRDYDDVAVEVNLDIEDFGPRKPEPDEGPEYSSGSIILVEDLKDDAGQILLKAGENVELLINWDRCDPVAEAFQQVFQSVA